MDSIQFPEGRLLPRRFRHRFPVISHGQGVFLFDRSGRRYLDASAGALVASVGHGNREVVEPIAEQLSRAAYVNGTQFASEVAESLAARLARLTRSSGLERAVLLCSGTEAVEAALKLARQIQVVRGESERTRVVSRSPSYHGGTLFALSASGRPRCRELYGPLLTRVHQVRAPYQYRSGREEYGAGEYLAELEALFDRDGASIMAFLMETVGGSSTGASLPPPGYLEGVRELCDRHGILLVADEILCGAGRTGSFLAGEAWGFAPDLLVLGKGIGGGYAPLSAVMARESDVSALAEAGQDLAHAQTFMHAPSIAAAGDAVIDCMERHKLIENSARMGELLHRLLEENIADLPQVGFVTGKGLLAGIEFVEDARTRRPFPRARRFVEGLVGHAFNRGLILWPETGSADGVNGDLVLIGPPLVIREDEVRELVELLGRCLVEYVRP